MQIDLVFTFENPSFSFERERGYVDVKEALRQRAQVWSHFHLKSLALNARFQIAANSYNTAVVAAPVVSKIPAFFGL